MTPCHGGTTPSGQVDELVAFMKNRKLFFYRSLAAIVGREFDFDTLQKASEVDDDALIKALEHAERAQIISEERRAGRIVFSFAHVLIPATLRDRVSGLRRQRMQSRVANAIEALRPEDFGTLA